MIDFVALTKIYAESYKEVFKCGFSDENLAVITAAKVTQGTYGLAVKFSLKGGGCFYYPVAKDTACSVGDAVNPAKATMAVLARGFDTSKINWEETDINALQEDGKDIIIRVSF